MRYQLFNLRVPLEATSTTRLTLRMCHGCVYTGSFVLDYHALYLLQHFIELFRNRSVHEFYRLKALITLEQLISSVVEKRSEDRGSMIENGGSGIENQGSVIS